jgi:hypothetical protein
MTNLLVLLRLCIRPLCIRLTNILSWNEKISVQKHDFLSLDYFLCFLDNVRPFLFWSKASCCLQYFSAFWDKLSQIFSREYLTTFPFFVHKISWLFILCSLRIFVNVPPGIEVCPRFPPYSGLFYKCFGWGLARLCVMDWESLNLLPIPSLPFLPNSRKCGGKNVFQLCKKRGAVDKKN